MGATITEDKCVCVCSCI